MFIVRLSVEGVPALSRAATLTVYVPPSGKLPIGNACVHVGEVPTGVIDDSVTLPNELLLQYFPVDICCTLTWTEATPDPPSELAPVRLPPHVRIGPESNTWP